MHVDLSSFVTRIVLSAVALAPLAGCADGQRSRSGTGIMAYSENARRSYEQAMELMKSKDWLEASSQFRELRRKFSFSGYAALSQLRLADIEFEQEKYLEAISAYKSFMRENPKHAETAWARMRIARSYYAQIGDSLLLPPQDERDQSAVVEAARELKNYLEEYPDGPEHAKVTALAADALARLVAHELYVARYYINKNKLDAALSRATYAVTKFRGSSRDVEALITQGEILMMLKRTTDAKATFRYVIGKYPKDPRSAQARRFLAKLDPEG